MQIGTNPLTQCIRENRIEDARFIIVESKNSHKFSQWADWVTDAQYHALKNGSLEAVEMFVDENVTFRKCQWVEDFPEHLLTTAAQSGSAQKVQALLQGGILDCDKDKLTNSERGLLHAVRCGNVDVVRSFLEAGISASSTTHLSETRWKEVRAPMLTVAAMEGHAEIVSLLIERGADLTAAFDYGIYNYRQQLQGLRKIAPKAAETLAAKISTGLRILMDHAVGTDLGLHCPDNSYRCNRPWNTAEGKIERQQAPLSFLKGLDLAGVSFVGVAAAGPPITKETLERLQAYTPKEGDRSGASDAIGYGHPEIARKLMDLGHEINDYSGKDAALCATDSASPWKVVKQFWSDETASARLLNPKNLAGNDGNTALQCCLSDPIGRYLDPKIIEFILSRGIDVNLWDDKDKTALHILGENGQVQLAQIIVDAGGDKSAKGGPLGIDPDGHSYRASAEGVKGAASVGKLTQSF